MLNVDIIYCARKSFYFEQIIAIRDDKTTLPRQTRDIVSKIVSDSE